MGKQTAFIILSVVFLSCQPTSKYEIDQEVLTSLGSKYKTSFSYAYESFREQAEADSTNISALLGMAEMQVLLRCFGFVTYEASVPIAQKAVNQALGQDSLNASVHTMNGIVGLLDWNWKKAESALLQGIEMNPEDPKARHWYSLYLVTMDSMEEAMLHSDTVVQLDTSNDYLIGHGSLLYFEQQWDDLVPLMIKASELDPEVPWTYDWLGMAYNGQENHELAIETYLKAFEMSDGTVEVGGGLGHALGDAGEYELAKSMTNYYDEAAKSNYLPPVQRAFIHISIEEYDKAIELLEQAYEEKSWFLAFIQSEHWYDPIREDPRFVDIMERMNFPE